jgi:hypothetical protein
MTTTTIDTARYIELNHLFNSKDRLYLYGLLNKLSSGYDAGLACLDAMLQHRVYTMSTIARTANQQGYSLDAGSAYIQVGRICGALAEAAGLNEEVTEYGAVCGEGRCAHSFLAQTVSSYVTGAPSRDPNGEMIWALRPGYCC